MHLLARRTLTAAALAAAATGTLRAQSLTALRAIADSAFAAAAGGDETVGAARRRWPASSSAPAERLGRAWLDLATYRYAEARTGFGALADTLSAAPAPLAQRARLGLGLVLTAETRFREALPHLEATARAAEAAADSVLLAETLIRLAGVQARLAGFAPARATFERARVLAPPADTGLLAMIACQDAGFLAMTGDPRLTEVARRGIRLATIARQPGTRGVCHINLARALLNRQQVDSALAEFEVGAEVARAAHDESLLAGMEQWHGFARTLVGEYGRARERYRRALVAAERSGNRLPVPWVYLGLSGIAGSTGDLPEARRLYDLALAEYERQGDRWGLASARYRQAQVLWRLDDTVATRQALETARTELTTLGAVAQAVPVRHDLILLDIAAGRLDDAERALAALRRDGAGEADRAVQDPAYLEGTLATARGQAARARAAFPRAAAAAGRASTM
ncbi:MAG: hypothetical protein NW201_14400, partial [Gemmatimonadales bacterium]|nr:hypothetical protein [Gemmatimonadales bacterium]